jgi:hypothetical protein
MERGPNELHSAHEGGSAADAKTAEPAWKLKKGNDKATGPALARRVGSVALK